MKRTRPGTQQGEVWGLGTAVGKAGPGGRRKKTANEQQRRTPVKPDVG